MSITINNWSSGIQVDISGKIATNVERKGMQKKSLQSPIWCGGNSSQHLYVISEYHQIYLFIVTKYIRPLSTTFVKIVWCFSHIDCSQIKKTAISDMFLQGDHLMQC